MWPPLPSTAHYLSDFLRYYGAEFNNELMVIVRGEYILLGPPPCPYCPELLKLLQNGLVVYDPFRAGVNATVNVTRFREIQDRFLAVYGQIFMQTKLPDNESSSNILETAFTACPRLGPLNIDLTPA